MPSLDPISGPLGQKNADHLLRRTTFGARRQDIESFATKTASEAVESLFEPSPLPDPPVDPATGEPWVNPKPGPGNSETQVLIDYFIGWHMEQMRKENTGAREKMTYFLHTFLPVSREKVQSSTAIYYQNQLYRHYAFGSYKELFVKVIFDNAMLVYIDNYLNTAENPNENFAREMFELYTIGKGPQIAPGDYTHFTEEDIKAAARVLTGYIYDESFGNYDPDLLPDVKIAQGKIFTVGEDKLAYLHDAGAKTFSDKFQNRVIEPNEVLFGYATESAVRQELLDLIDMIFDQEETARFICRKLYRFFVYNKIDETVESDIIEPLAQTMRENNYEFKPVLEQLFKSQHFYDADNATITDDHIGAMIKSPPESLINLFRFFDVELPEDPFKLYEESYRAIINGYLYVMGMSFYIPPDVAGYPAYFQAPGYHRNWITPTNLAFRYWLIFPLLDGVRNPSNELLFQLDVLNWVETPGNISNPENPETLVRELTGFLFAGELAEERLEFFLNTFFLEGFPAYYWTNEWNNYLNTGDDSIVRFQLAKLVLGLVQSPEMQLS
jgi:uncharacterized protein (DUF1800 family)